MFIAVDHCNSECIGIHADRSANRFQALEPIRQGVTRHFGAVAKDIATGLKLRHDHGSNYMSNDFQKEIDFLGIKASPSFVREPEGNGVAERFIRTLKENLLWVRDFETIEELRLALIEFARWYNDNWLVARHRYKNPSPGQGKSDGTTRSGRMNNAAAACLITGDAVQTAANLANRLALRQGHLGLSPLADDLFQGRLRLILSSFYQSSNTPDSLNLPGPHFPRRVRLRRLSIRRCKAGAECATCAMTRYCRCPNLLWVV